VLTRLFPFLRWFPLRADAIAGVSVALELVPQSIGLRATGRHAAVLPPVRDLPAGDRRLAMGLVEPARDQSRPVSSILTASALAPLAALGSEQFVAYAILLAFMVGVIQLGLGVSRLGSVVSFLSHPAILGFTSAAAIVIALSQLNKLLGLPIGRSAFFLANIWEMLGQIRDVHGPSVAIGLGSMAIIWGCRRWLPGVLLGSPARAALGGADHRAGRFRRGDLDRQGDRRQDPPADRRQPGADRPGPVEPGRQLQPGVSDHGFVLALGRQLQRRRAHGRDRALAGVPYTGRDPPPTPITRAWRID
jgi:hypothetical protein